MRCPIRKWNRSCESDLLNESTEPIYNIDIINTFYDVYGLQNREWREDLNYGTKNKFSKKPNSRNVTNKTDWKFTILLYDSIVFF